MRDCISRQAQQASFGALMDVRISCHSAFIADAVGLQARMTLATEPHAASIGTRRGVVRS